MEAPLAALADPARWRLVALLAERPRSVGVLAQLAGARQPQTTKHLQALERAGLVTSQRTGQRRVYALQAGPLRDLAAALVGLADTVDGVGAAGSPAAGAPGSDPGGAADGVRQSDSPRATFDRYGLSLDAERSAAGEPGWADGRTFRFRRSLAAHPALVWRHLTETALLARWWTPDGLRVSELVFEARPGGRIVHEYRDIDDADDSDLVVGRAEGVVDDVRPEDHLSYRLSPLLPDGRIAFTAHLDLDLTAGDSSGTHLDVHWRITESTVDSADFIAGIEIGFGQGLDRLAVVTAAAASPDATRDGDHQP